MGFFKSLFSSKALAENIIKVNEETYFDLKKKHPDRDEHWLLANTWLKIFSSTKEAKRKGPELMKFIAWKDTLNFSILDPPKSIRALALYIVYKEVPSEAYRYEEEVNKIMEPIMRMRDDGTFMGLYRKKNPNSAKQMDELDKSE